MNEKGIDFRSLTTEDLQEEYALLHRRYQELRQASDDDLQRIHELTRNLKTANASAEYLSQELDAISNQKPEVKANAEQEDQLQRLGARFAILQQDYDALLEENAQLRSDLAEAKKEPQIPAAPPLLETSLSSNDLTVERLNQLEHENLGLLQQLDELQVTHTMNSAQREKNIEILRDQVHCLEENLRSKRDELEERNLLLESAQEQLAEANAKVAMLTTAPEDDARKGNSLFAEVDDQRQAMKQLLAAQKKSYLQMKKIYNESEHEIRRLKRENIAMHTELHACTSIFCNADKTYQNKLNVRIRQLLNQNDDYERKLSWTQARLKELASEKDVLWLDSMLTFCKKETDDLKKQLHSVRIQNGSLEEQLRNLQQNMARWRFEGLKSRCLLLDRENLLNEHKISFKSVRDLDFRITKKQQDTAVPCITNGSDGAVNNLVDTSKSNVNVKREELSTVSPQKSIDSKAAVEDAIHLASSTINIKLETPEENKENLLSAQQIETITESPLPSQILPLTPLKVKNDRQKSPTSPLIKLKSFAFESQSSDLDSNLPGRSILSKNRDIFDSKEKNVKFSTNEATVVGPETITIADDKADDVEPFKATTNKQKRTKSSIIMRRVVVVSSKHKLS